MPQQPVSTEKILKINTISKLSDILQSKKVVKTIISKPKSEMNFNDNK